MTSAGGSDWQPTEREQSAYAHLYSLVDTGGEGVVRGQAAVPFFQKSGLPDAVLGEIWQLADAGSKGHLTTPEFGVAMKLISLAQAQRPVALDGLGSDTGLPELKGVAHRVGLGSPSTGSLAGARGRSGSSTSSAGWPRGLAGAAESLDNLSDTVVPAREKQQYAQIFAGSGPTDGALSGAAARALFTKTKLDGEQLARIWALADPRGEDKLRLPGFIVAMYFIRRTMESRSFELPAVCPPSLWRSAGGDQLARSPLGSVSQTSLGGVLSPELGAAQWDVTKDEWRRYEQFFDSLDSQRAGYLVGDVPVNFFLKSKLPDEELSRVWDLADVQRRGRLSKEEFAVAMHLINARLAGAPIPDKLSPTLVPPSMRRPQPASASSAASRVHSISPQLRPASTVGRVQQINDIKRAASYSSSSLRESVPEALPRAATARVAADDAELAALQSRISQIEGQSQVLHGQRAVTAGQLASATTRKQELEVRLAAVQSSHEAEQRINHDLEATLADEEARASALQEQVAEANRRLAAVLAQHGQLEQAVHRAQTQQLALAQRLHQAQEDEHQLSAEIESLELQKQQFEQRLAAAQAQIRDQQQANAGLSQRVGELRRDADELAQQAEAAERETPSFDDIFGTGDSHEQEEHDQEHEALPSSNPATSSIDDAAALSARSESLPPAQTAPMASTSAFDTFGAHSADPFEEFLQSATASPQPAAAATSNGRAAQWHSAEDVDAKTKQFNALFVPGGAPAATRSTSKPLGSAASWEAADPRSVTSTPAPGDRARAVNGVQVAKSTPSSPPLSGASKHAELLEVSGQGFAADFGTAFGELPGASDRAISRDIEAFETKFPDIGALGISEGGPSGDEAAPGSSGAEGLTFESVFGGDDSTAAPKATAADGPAEAAGPAAKEAAEASEAPEPAPGARDAPAPEQPQKMQKQAEAKSDGKASDGKASDGEVAVPAVVRRTNGKAE
ncbi:hypothetical protein H4R19_003656 [Coemansia spiralis]|nr:hypothetical protein H4R19_003656 [Coemansia spiralis]